MSGATKNNEPDTISTIKDLASYLKRSRHCISRWMKGPEWQWGKAPWDAETVQLIKRWANYSAVIDRNGRLIRVVNFGKRDRRAARCPHCGAYMSTAARESEIAADRQARQYKVLDDKGVESAMLERAWRKIGKDYYTERTAGRIKQGEWPKPQQGAGDAA